MGVPENWWLIPKLTIVVWKMRINYIGIYWICGGYVFPDKAVFTPGDSNAWGGTGAGTNSKDQLEIEIEVHDSIHYIPIRTTYSNQPSTKARCFAFDQPFQSSNPSIPDCHNEWYEVEYVQCNLPYPNQCWRYPALSHLEIGDNRSAKIQSIIFRTNNFNFAVDRHIQCLGKLTFPLSTSFFRIRISMNLCFRWFITKFSQWRHFTTC